MIHFNNLSCEKPFLLFKEKYDEALELKQKNIEAISISTYNKEKNEVDSRFVNLKFIDNDKFIFFTNYNSPKSRAFETHNQISGLFFWTATNVQIRIKARIEKTSSKYNQGYFKNRTPEKNALAISSAQSELVSSYNTVVKNYNETYEGKDLSECPEYWGGFSFTPYYFEFWEGNENRLNKRESFALSNKEWPYSILQP